MVTAVVDDDWFAANQYALDAKDILWWEIDAKHVHGNGRVCIGGGMC